MQTYRARRRCLVCSLEEVHDLPSGERKVPPAAVEQEEFAGLAPDVVIEGRDLTSLGTEVQAIQLSPYLAGLAGQKPTRLPLLPAFRTCSGPLGLSPPGK